MPAPVWFDFKNGRAGLKAGRRGLANRRHSQSEKSSRSLDVGWGSDTLGKDKVQLRHGLPKA